MRAFQSDDAFEKIREKIVSMEWAPGTRLSSNQIAAELSMSRTPGERALVNLERYGLVEAENGKYSVSTFSLKDIVELYQVKEAVETQAVKILLERGGRFYLLVCCLKTGCDYENDWRSPGVCYGAALPEDLRALGREPLVLTPLKVGMLKNHGYSQQRLSGHDAAVVAWEGGVARFDPPAAPGEPWEIKPLLSVPTSDAVLADFDGDGQLELGCISPFHGASLTIYHLDDCGNYVPRWKYPAPEAETAFLHATWAAPLLGRMCWVVGWRAGSRQTVAVSYDPARGDYVTALLDSGTGCANAMAWVDGAGCDCVVATNREIDRVALYRLQNSDGLW